LQLDGKALLLPRRVALSGTRFAKGDITLRIAKGGHDPHAREAIDRMCRRVIARASRAPS
jgi:hypothetical protein